MNVFAEWESKLLAVALALAAASPALALGPEFRPLTGRIMRLRCHMDMCQWWRIDEAKVTGESAKGVLFEFKTTSWQSRHKNGNYDRPAPKTGESHETSYFFCSKQKPAVVWMDDGKWAAALLRPGDENAVFGASESAYAQYWAACHNVYVDDVYAQGTKLGRKLGYRLSGETPPEDVKIGEPSDVLKW